MLQKRELQIDLNHERHGPTVICKDLLDQGMKPDTPISFYRGTTLCFTSPTTVGEWASMSVKEATNGKPMRFVKA